MKIHSIRNLNFSNKFSDTTIKQNQTSVMFGSNILPYKDFPVPCAYCRSLMVPPSIIDKIKWPNANDIMPAALYNKKLFAVLDPLEQYMHKAERQVFHQLKALNQEHPNEPFQNLLYRIRSKPLCKLKHNELSIISQMQDCLDFHNPAINENEKAKDAAIELAIYLENTKNQKLRIGSPEIFKRKTFISQIEQIISGMETIPAFKNIWQKSLSLPTSKSDANAFIVKYSDKSTVRSSEEIARNLIIGSFQTFDHINPRNPLPGYPAGLTRQDNALGVCAYDNSMVKGNMPFSEFIALPNVVDNIVYQIKFLAAAFSKRKVFGGASYLKAVIKSLKEFSKGVIKIDSDTLRKINSISIRETLPNGKVLTRD